MRYRSMLLCLLTMSLSQSAAAFQKPDFPRLATYWLGNQNYENEAIQQDLARNNIAIIGIWDGWEGSHGITLENLVRSIKAKNPNTMVFQYMLTEAIPASQPAAKEPVDKINQMSWWLYPSGTTGTPVPSFFGQGYVTVNNTLLTRTDANGDHWLEWYAKWNYRKYAVPSPSLDGFFLDNVMWRPRVDGDWNLDGTKDSYSSSTAGIWQRQAYAKHFDLMHQLMPGKFQLGNITEWGLSDVTVTEMIGKPDGGLMEDIIGSSWSIESWGSWQDMMNYYRKTMASVAEPKLVVFEQDGSATDYKAFRYGFASCLMDDGYYAFSVNGGDSIPFDEYAVKLGPALQSPRTAAWQNGVYRRDFQNAIVLVNPRGNGSRTVQLEADFRRLKGVQDPVVNDGSVTRAVTLQDRDGIVLLRTEVPPSPPTLTTVE